MQRRQAVMSGQTFAPSTKGRAPSVPRMQRKQLQHAACIVKRHRLDSSLAAPSALGCWAGCTGIPRGTLHV